MTRVFILLAVEAPVSDKTRICLDCHASIRPGIVESWESGGLARSIPAAALILNTVWEQPLTRRMAGA